MYELRVYPGGPPGEFAYFRIFHQGVQMTRGSIILPGDPEFVIIPTRGSAGRFFFYSKTTVFGPLGQPEPGRFFIFLPIVGGEIRFRDWFVVFLNSKVGNGRGGDEGQCGVILWRVCWGSWILLLYMAGGAQHELEWVVETTPPKPFLLTSLYPNNPCKNSRHYQQPLLQLLLQP